MKRNDSKTSDQKALDLSIPESTSGYHYDPQRACKRRVVAYSADEFKKLSKEEQRRVLRNRETAAASKARKRQKLQDLQQHAGELEANKQQLEAKLKSALQELQKARAGTTALLQKCECGSCKQLRTQLAQVAEATDAMKSVLA